MPKITKKDVNTATVVILCFVFIMIGGIFYDIHEHTPAYRRSPIYWPIAIAFSSAGGTTLFGMLLPLVMPQDILSAIQSFQFKK